MAKFVAIPLIYVCEIMNTYVLDEQKLKKETMKKICYKFSNNFSVASIQKVSHLIKYEM